MHNFNALPVDFHFSDVEKHQITQTFMSITTNPYTNYDNFMSDVDLSIDRLPSRFTDFCSGFVSRNCSEKPIFAMTNCPVDPELPVFSNENPVEEKRKKKKSYVAEGFLAAYARIMNENPIGYLNVNDGDVFQDIFPKESMKDTQSQKALGNIYFHKDLANHFVRPDWVNILGLRGNKENVIYTMFVRNIDVLSEFSPTEQEALRQHSFYTPFDDLTTWTNNVDVGDASTHPILSDDIDLRFFENRTVGLTQEAKHLVSKVIDALHKHKKGVLMVEGDFVGACNNCCIHNKEIRYVGNLDQQWRRWLMKTVNVADLAMHAKYFVKNTNIVNG